MSNDLTFTDTILNVERLNNSRLGNPTWLVHFVQTQSLRTMSDTQWSYEADNPEWKNAKVIVTVTPGNRIRYCTHVEKKRGRKMKLITVQVKADLDDEKNRYLDGTTIADHLDEIVKGESDDVVIEFGSGDVVSESTLVSISVVEMPEWKK